MWRNVFVLIGLIVLTGCTSFHRDWKKASEQPVTAGDIQGAWDGLWKSDSNGHKGRLRCLVTKVDERGYEARFHAKYRKVLSFGYDVYLQGNWSNATFICFGEADLGKLAGGVYKYAATISETNFFSTYDSKYDRGIFEMQRLKR